MSDLRILRSRLVFPVVGDPVQDGMVAIRDGRIAAVGKSIAGPVEDLGNVALLPGLVNAHTHLEFSGLPQPLGWPGISFAPWTRLVMASRRESSLSSTESVRRGLAESLAHGVAAVGEIAQPGWTVEVAANSGLQTVVFLELLAPTASRVAAAENLARQHVEGSSTRWTANLHPGLAPHAPHTVQPSLLATAVALSAARQVPLAFHLAETREELELLRSGTGPLRSLLQGLGAWDPTVVRPGSRPMDYLRQLSQAYRSLVIHGNYLDDEEIGFLARHADRMAVVYCPRTHAFFGHTRYPLEQMLAAGVHVALGTDSRASAPDLSILAEMRWVARNYPQIGRDVVLQLGTIRAAAALGLADHCGSIQPGNPASLTAVPLPDRDVPDPYELLFSE